jgi:uncharacterized protein (TIGR03435 family)
MAQVFVLLTAAMRRRYPIRICAGFLLAAAAALGQTPAAASAFEVASIKPAAPITPQTIMSGKVHVGMTVDAARVDIGNSSLADLIRIAYRVKPYQVSGPGWMSSERFDVIATIPEGASSDQVPEMLQALLAERFKLVAHRESKERAVYALVVGKNGSNLKESAPDADAPNPDSASGGVAFATAGGTVRVNKDSKTVVVTGGRGLVPTRVSMGPDGMHLEFAKITLGALADTLSSFVDRPVVDMTELKGNYQVTLDLAMEDMRSVAMKAATTAGIALPGAIGAGDTAKGPADAASDPSGGSIFAAIQKLGLKLDPRKAPVETMVIDRLEKSPTEN